MDGKKIYRITDGDYTPTGRWDEYPHLMDYKHAANAAAKQIRDTATLADLDQLLQGGLTIWGGSLEIVTTQGDRVTYDRDCEPAEGAYIATALQRAIRERRQRSIS